MEQSPSCRRRTHRSPLASLRDPAFAPACPAIRYVQSTASCASSAEGLVMTERVSDAGTREIPSRWDWAPFTGTREASRDLRELSSLGRAGHVHRTGSPPGRETTGWLRTDLVRSTLPPIAPLLDSATSAPCSTPLHLFEFPRRTLPLYGVAGHPN